MFFALPMRAPQQRGEEGLPCPPDLLGSQSAGSNAATPRLHRRPSRLVCFCPPSRRGGRSHILCFARIIYHQHVMKNIRCPVGDV